MWAGTPPSPLIAVPNVTTHPSTASVPITVLLYSGPLLCGCNVSIWHKGLSHSLRGSNWRRAGAYCIDSDRLVFI